MPDGSSGNSEPTSVKLIRNLKADIEAEEANIKAVNDRSSRRLTQLRSMLAEWEEFAREKGYVDA